MSGSSSCLSWDHEKTPASSRPIVTRTVTLRFATASCVSRITSCSLTPGRLGSRPRPTDGPRYWRGRWAPGCSGRFRLHSFEDDRDQARHVRHLVLCQDAKDLAHHLETRAGHLIDEPPAGFGKPALDHSPIVQAMLPCHEAVPLNPLNRAACRWQSHAQPLRNSAHWRGSVLGEKKEQAQLAERKLLRHPLGNVWAILIPEAAERVNYALELELLGGYFAHERIVRRLANSCSSSE